MEEEKAAKGSGTSGAVGGAGSCLLVMEGLTDKAAMKRQQDKGGGWAAPRRKGAMGEGLSRYGGPELRLCPGCSGTARRPGAQNRTVSGRRRGQPGGRSGHLGSDLRFSLYGELFERFAIQGDSIELITRSL